MSIFHHMRITNSNISSNGWYIFQSVYPPVIAMGLPTAHHIVVYMLAQLPQEHTKINLTLQQSEVDAAAWLDVKTVAEVVQSDEYGKTRNVGQKYFRYICLSFYQLK